MTNSPDIAGPTRADSSTRLVVLRGLTNCNKAEVLIIWTLDDLVYLESHQSGWTLIQCWTTSTVACRTVTLTRTKQAVWRSLRT